MIAKPREDELHIKIVTRSGVVMGDDKDKKKVEEALVRKTTKNAPRFSIQKGK